MSAFFDSLWNHRLIASIRTLGSYLSEQIFLKPREKGRDRDKEIEKANKGISEVFDFIGHLPSSRNVSENLNIEQLKKLSVHMFMMKNILENARITLSVVNSSNRSELILHDTHFYVIKFIHAWRIGQHGKGFNSVYNNDDLKKEFLLQKAASDIAEAFELFYKTDKDKVQFLNDLVKELNLNAEVQLARLPIRAPERWRDRHEKPDADKKKENPIDFFARVYEPWLDNGITRAHISKIDRDLYSAICRSMEINPNRIFNYPENVQTALQSQSERLTKDINENPPHSESLAERELDRKERQRLYSGAHRRR